MFSKHVGDEIMFIAYSRGKLHMPFLMIGLIMHDLPFKLLEFEKEYDYYILCITLISYVGVIGIERIKDAYLTPMEYFELDKLLYELN